MAQFQKRVNIEVIDANNGQACKIACMSCIRGHRTTSCGITNCRNKVFWSVKRPGRPSNACNCAMVGGVCICTLSVPNCPHKAKRGGKRSIDCRCDEQGRFCCYVTQKDWDTIAEGGKPRLHFFDNRDELRRHGDPASASRASTSEYVPSEYGHGSKNASDEALHISGDKVPIPRRSLVPTFGLMGVGAPLGSREQTGEDVFQWDNTPPAPRQFRSQTSPGIFRHYSRNGHDASYQQLYRDHQPSLSAHPQIAAPTVNMGVRHSVQDFPIPSQRMPSQLPPQAQVMLENKSPHRSQSGDFDPRIHELANQSENPASSNHSRQPSSDELASPGSLPSRQQDQAQVQSCCGGSSTVAKSGRWRTDTASQPVATENEDLDAFMQQYILNQFPLAMCQQCGRRDCSCSMCPPVMQTGGTSNWGVCGRVHERNSSSLHHPISVGIPGPEQDQSQYIHAQDNYAGHDAIQQQHTCCQEPFTQPQFIHPSSLSAESRSTADHQQHRHDSQQQSSTARSSSMIGQSPAKIELDSGPTSGMSLVQTYKESQCCSKKTVGTQQQPASQHPRSQRDSYWSQDIANLEQDLAPGNAKHDQALPFHVMSHQIQPSVNYAVTESGQINFSDPFAIGDNGYTVPINMFQQVHQPQQPPQRRPEEYSGHQPLPFGDPAMPQLMSEVEQDILRVSAYPQRITGQPPMINEALSDSPSTSGSYIEPSGRQEDFAFGRVAEHG